MKVLTVIGNRPQFVKAAAISPLLREHHDELLVHTGQHYDHMLSDVFFEELSLPAPDIELGIAGGSNAGQVGRMLEQLDPVVRDTGPDAVLVYGDTNSTLAGALVAAHLGVQLVHVEAGLRSFDRSMPEEINRVVADALSNLLLAPSETAVSNLAAEGVAGRVDLVGDVMGDMTLKFAQLASERSTIGASEQLVARQFVFVTAHRAGNVDTFERLRQLVELLASIELPVVFAIHPRTRQRLSDFDLADRLASLANVRTLEPLGYIDTLWLVENARAVVTDSGGLQKEACWLGTQCLTLRDRTEWVETVTSGWNTLVDLDPVAAAAALAVGTPEVSGLPLYRAGLAAAAVVASIDSLEPASPALESAP